MKRRRFGRQIAVVSLLAVVVAILVAATTAGLFPGLRLSLPDFALGRNSRSEISDALLTRIQDALGFNTVSYIYKTVFPYDYMPQDLSIEEILNAVHAGTGTTDTLLTPRERLFLEAYNLATDAGLHSGANQFDFVVVTSVVTAGYDLKSGHDSGSFEQIVSVSSKRDGSREVTVHLPAATISKITTEDISHATYHFPDASISPDQWKRIAEFVTAQVRQQTVDDGVLTVARQNAEKFLGGVLREAGFTDVRFE